MDARAQFVGLAYRPARKSRRHGQYQQGGWRQRSRASKQQERMGVGVAHGEGDGRRARCAAMLREGAGGRERRIPCLRAGRAGIGRAGRARAQAAACAPMRRKSERRVRTARRAMHGAAIARRRRAPARHCASSPSSSTGSSRCASLSECVDAIATCGRSCERTSGVTCGRYGGRAQADLRARQSELPMPRLHAEPTHPVDFTGRTSG